MWACLLGGVGWGHAGEQCVCLGPGRAACAEGRPGLGLLQAASAGPRPNPLREQPAAGWRGRRWSVWPAEVFLRRVWGTWEPQVGGLLPSLGRGGPHLPAWVQLGLVLASGIWWWVLGSQVRPGWAWGSGGELVGCSPAAGLVPASAQRAVPPPICRCRRARRPSGPLRPLGLRVWGRQSRVFCRPGDWGARAGHTASCCLPQAFRVEGLGGTGQGGRVYPGLAVGLAGGRGVRTEGLCGPAIGELLAGTWTQRHVHLTSPAVSTSEMDQQVWARPQCAAGA